MNDTKVLGFIAAADRIHVFCEGDSCIIAGSEKAMRKYLADSCEDWKEYSITKARYGRVFQVLRQGASYSFDAESYARFRPLVFQDGFDPGVFPTGIAMPAGGVEPLLRVQMKRRIE